MMPGTPGGGTSVLLALLVCLFLGAVVYLELSTSIAPEVASNSPTEDGATQVERPSLPPETAYEPPPFEQGGAVHTGYLSIFNILPYRSGQPSGALL